MQFIVLVLGSAALALWLAVRFERLGPRSAGDALVRCVAACLVGALVGPLMDFWLARPLPRPGFFAVMLGAVPVLVVMFLAGAWLLLALGGSFAPGGPPGRQRLRPRVVRPAIVSFAGFVRGGGGNELAPMREGVSREEREPAPRARGGRTERRVALVFVGTVVAAQVAWLGCIGFVVALVIH